MSSEGSDGSDKSDAGTGAGASSAPGSAASPHAPSNNSEAPQSNAADPSPTEAPQSGSPEAPQSGSPDNASQNVPSMQVEAGHPSGTAAHPSGHPTEQDPFAPGVSPSAEQTPSSGKTASSSGSPGAPSGGGPRPPRRKKGERVTVTTARIGFVGAGKIADAIVRGLIGYAKVNPQFIYVSSKSGRSLDQFKQMGTVVSKRAYDIFGRFDCDVIFVATHGCAIRECYKMGGTRPMALTTNYIPNQRHALYVLSLAGNITANELKNTLLNPEKPDKYQMALNRVMLNICVAYGAGFVAIDVEPDSRKFFPIVRDLFSSMAKTIEYAPDNNIDQVCAVAGNGLAFVYYYLTALADGGFKMGLSKTIALKLAAKTLQAAGTSLLESNKNPAQLRDECTSPSGSAIYGLHMLDKQDASSGIASAVETAYKRIKELSETH